MKVIKEIEQDLIKEAMENARKNIHYVIKIQAYFRGYITRRMFYLMLF
jgi:hypothetical protein